jgi:hypothetical protein
MDSSNKSFGNLTIVWLLIIILAVTVINKIVCELVSY